jgi:hypothetical protein
MNQYQPSTPRAALAIGAAAMTTIVLGLSIIVPASLQPDQEASRTAASLQAAIPAPLDGVLVLPRMEVLGVAASDLVQTRSGAEVQTADLGTAKPAAVARARCRSLAKGKAADSHST